MHYHSKLTDLQHFTINSSVGIFSTAIVSMTLYPLQYVRQLLSNRIDDSGIGIWHQLKKTIKKKGVMELFKGSHIFLYGLFIFRGTYFGIFDSLRFKTDSQYVRLAISCLAIYIGVFVAYPGDTIRRRLVTSKNRYKGFVDCFKQVWQKDGIKGIFYGWQMIWLQSLMGGIYFFCFDKLFTDYSQAFS